MRTGSLLALLSGFHRVCSSSNPLDSDGDACPAWVPLLGPGAYGLLALALFLAALFLAPAIAVTRHRGA